MESLCRHGYLKCSRAVVGGHGAESKLCMLDNLCGEGFIRSVMPCGVHMTLDTVFARCGIEMP